MVSTPTPVCDFDWQAVDFDLPGVDGQRHGLASARGAKGLLVMFICNHCPYVKAVIHRIVRDTRELASLGINTIAIMSNDPTDYPEDSWSRMVDRMSWTKPSGSPRPMGRYAHRISSASTPTCACSTGAGWTPRARKRRRTTRDATCSRP